MRAKLTMIGDRNLGLQNEEKSVSSDCVGNDKRIRIIRIHNNKGEKYDRS